MRLIVAGGGLAGLSAAVRAAGLGARVELLEKGETAGGSLPHSSGYLWSYNDFDTFREQAPGGDPALQSLHLELIEGALQWLEFLGAPVLSRETGNPLTSGARLDPQGLFDALMKRLNDSGAEVRTGAALSGVLHESGRVTGARLSSGGDRPADAVVLATGGFGANRELVGRYVTENPGELRLRANPRGTGDGLNAALQLGARRSTVMDEFYGRNMPAPPAEFVPSQWVEVSQLYGRYAVAINSNGQRYADESADWSETRLTQATARQPGLRAWYVLDAGCLGAYVRGRAVVEMVGAARRVGGNVIEAETLEELAERLAESGVPRDKFLRTLEDYNAAVEKGWATRISPPRSEPALPVEKSPFVAVEVAPAITHTMGGLMVDANCRVSGENGPIPGLYAAGVDIGGVATGGYVSGLAQALVFGMVAAESAVGDQAVSETR